MAGKARPQCTRRSEHALESSGEPAPYADVEVSFAPGLGVRPIVRSIAAEAANAEPTYAQQVRETTDTLVRALLLLAHEDSHLHCLFRVLDGEVRIRTSLSAPPAPVAKGHSVRRISRLDVHVSAYTVARDDKGVELVYEAVVPRRRPPR